MGYTEGPTHVRPIPAELGGRVWRTDKFSFREGWVWPRDVRRWFVRETSDLLDPCPKPIVHLCCGSSRLGEIRVDREHPGANVRADMFHLPFKDGSVGTLIIDPPFNIACHQRIALHRELGRVTKPGSRLLWCAPWLPPEGWFDYNRVVVGSLRTGLPRNARLLVRATRRPPGPKTGKGQRKHPRRYEHRPRAAGGNS